MKKKSVHEKNISFRVIFEHPEKSLRDEIVRNEVKSILSNALQEQLKTQS